MMASQDVYEFPDFDGMSLDSILDVLDQFHGRYAIDALRSLPVEQRMAVMGMKRVAPPVHSQSHRIPEGSDVEAFVRSVDPLECSFCHQPVVSGEAVRASGMDWYEYQRSDLPPHQFDPCPARNPPIWVEG